MDCDGASGVRNSPTKCENAATDAHHFAILLGSFVFSLQSRSGYSQLAYMQPSYGATTGFFQNGVQQQHWQESNTIPSNFAEQPQPSQQLYGQQPQQPYAQQLYGQQGQWTQGYGQPVQNMQAYSQQSAQPLYGQQGAATQAAYVQQMPGQQVVHAPAAVVGAQYCAQAEQIFFINEKWASLSRDDFSILDRTQQPVFKMDSSAFSVTQKRVLKTAKGQAVCSLKKKVVNLKNIQASSPWLSTTLLASAA